MPGNGGQLSGLRGGPAATPGAPRALTQLAHFQDLAQHPGQLDAAAAEGTLVLVLPTAVLKHDLQAEKGPVTEGGESNIPDEGCASRETQIPPARPPEALGAKAESSSKHVLSPWALNPSTSLSPRSFRRPWEEGVSPPGRH